MTNSATTQGNDAPRILFHAFPPGLPKCLLEPKSGSKKRGSNLLDKYLQAMRKHVSNTMVNGISEAEKQAAQDLSQDYPNLPLLSRLFFLPDRRQTLGRKHSLEAFLIREFNMESLVLDGLSDGNLEFNTGDFACCFVMRDTLSDEQEKLAIVPLVLTTMKALKHWDTLPLQNRQHVALLLFAVASEYESVALMAHAINTCPDVATYWEGIDLRCLQSDYHQTVLNVYYDYSSALEPCHAALLETQSELKLDAFGDMHLPDELLATHIVLQDRRFDAMVDTCRQLVKETQSIELHLATQLFELLETRQVLIKTKLKDLGLWGTEVKAKDWLTAEKQLAQLKCIVPVAQYNTTARHPLLTAGRYFNEVITAIEYAEYQIQQLLTQSASTGSNLTQISQHLAQVQTIKDSICLEVRRCLEAISDEQGVLNRTRLSGILDEYVKKYRSANDSLSATPEETVQPAPDQDDSTEFDELKETLEHWKLRCQDRDAEVTRLKAELFQAKQASEVQDADVQPLVVSQTDAISSINKLTLGTGEPVDALRALQALHPDAVEILPSAFDNASRSSQFRSVRRLYEVLTVLVSDYRQATLNGVPESEAKDLFGGAFRARESDTVRNNAQMRREREFRYQGKLRYFEKHLALGIGQGKNESIRVYFDMNAETGKVIIADCGEHKRTTQTC